MNKTIRRIKALTKRNITEIRRDPLSLIFMIAMPLVMEIVFYFLFRNLTAQFSMKYLAPGIAAFSCSFLSLFMGLLIAIDRSTSFLTRLYVSGAKAHEFILGYTFSLIPAALIQSLLFFGIGVIFDTSLLSFRLIPALLFTLIVALMFVGFGILIGSLCSEKSIGGVASILIAGQSILSGMWFPAEGLGEGMIKVMNALPFKNAVVLLQNVLNGTDDPKKGIVVPLLIVLAYTVAAYIAAVTVFRKKMKAD